MSKIDINKIMEEMHKLYAKEKKVSALICTGDVMQSPYVESDTVPFLDSSPLKTLLALPGIPYNKIIQVVGKPDSGKSTLALEMICSAQKKGIQVILWDSEQKFDANRLLRMGGVPKDVSLIKSNEILKGAEAVRNNINVVKSFYPDAKMLVIWDSIGGSQSRSHAERQLDSEKHAQPGQDAKENGSVMKTFVGLINKYPDSIAVYMANQSYAKIGFMQKGDAAAGGTKIEYHSHFIVFLKRIKVLTKTVKGKLMKYGIITRATVTKGHLSQTDTSVHQLDFQVTSRGCQTTEGSDAVEEESEDE